LLSQEQNTSLYKRWNENAISEVLKLLKTHSLKEVAQRLGTSPQSISKALMRRGISVCRYLDLTARKTSRRRKSKAFTKPTNVGISNATVRAIAYSSARGCRYPIGDYESSDFRFCNAPRTKKSFCKKHAAVVYEAAA
jgi:hypothetical protein